MGSSTVFREDLASLSIRRPTLVLVINLLIALAGVAALLAVEVRELPDVDRPIVSVRGHLPGASPETLDAEVTSLVEAAVARVSGIRNIRASSEENNFRVHIEFSAEVDLDTAAADVREAVSQVERELPDEVEQLTVIKADQDAEPVMNIAVTSDQLRDEDLSYIVEKDVVPEIIAIPGVADVALFGQRQRVLRVVLDPLRLTSYGLSVADVRAVLEDAPLDVPTGSFRSRDQELLVRTNASTVTEEQVRDTIISGNTRIGDVAYVSFGPEDAESLVYLYDKPVMGMGVVRQAQSNTIDISNRVQEAVARLNERFDHLELTIVEDRAVFIRGSVREVITSLAITVAIVVATIWAFFGSLRIALIPSAAIPVALIGTLAGIWLMGFSINILTLLALVLATGLVVDDAIVVLENIQRRRAQGLGPRAAAVLGTRQVIFAVIATTAVLVSVFVPISLLPSSTGQMFREFGMVLACAVIISSFVALSLVPAMAARLSVERREPRRLNRALHAVGGSLGLAYQRTLGGVLRHPWLAFGCALLISAGSLVVYEILDKELVPQEDRGVFYVDATGPDGVGLNYIARQAEHIEALAQPLIESGEMESRFTVVGRYDPNRARVVFNLSPWEQRQRSQQEIAAGLQKPLAGIPGAQVRIGSPGSLNMRGDSGGIEFALLGNNYDVIYSAARAMGRAIEDELPNLSQSEISYRPTQPQLSIEVDRRRAADLGIPLDNIATTLRTVVDGLDVVDLSVNDESIPVILETSATAVTSPGDLSNLFVANRDGDLLPLSSLVTFREESVAAQLDRYAQRRAIDIKATINQGYPLASAVEDLRGVAQELLPDGVELMFKGEAETLGETSREVLFTYGIALVVVFLVLCAQFEGFTSAAIIMAIVPFGLAAAVYALFLTGTSVNIYSQIGLVMLIGLMAKNGILMVEFADQLRDQGFNVHDAITQAATVRLRPISMTLLSTIMGGLPLILSSGPGAEARAAIGWVVFGGLGLAALFTLYLTPIVYLGIGRFHKPRAEAGQQLAAELDAAAKQGTR